MSAGISCVDVGQGDCTAVVDQPTGHGMLVDCPAGKHRVAIAELDHLGLTELRAAVVTHSHADHLGGVLDALEELADRFTGTLHFNQDTLAATPVAGGDRKIAGRRIRALTNRARELGDRVERAEAPAPWRQVGSVEWLLLAPTYPEVVAAVSAGKPNRASAVLHLRFEADSVVLGGDAPLSTWERIADNVPKGSIIRWPHHGGVIGDDDAHRRLVALLEPSGVVLSVGATNTYGHPTEEFFAASAGAPLLVCTQATGACSASGDPVGRCAGTIRILADGTGEPSVSAARLHHRAFIGSLGNARCLIAGNMLGSEVPHT